MYIYIVFVCSDCFPHSFGGKSPTKLGGLTFDTFLATDQGTLVFKISPLLPIIAQAPFGIYTHPTVSEGATPNLVGSGPTWTIRALAPLRD